MKSLSFLAELYLGVQKREVNEDSGVSGRDPGPGLPRGPLLSGTGGFLPKTQAEG